MKKPHFPTNLDQFDETHAQYIYTHNPCTTVQYTQIISRGEGEKGWGYTNLEILRTIFRHPLQLSGDLGHLPHMHTISL